MTTEAGTQHLNMIHPGRRAPIAVAMAGFATIAGIDVIRRFTGRRRTIVTARAAAANRLVVEIRRRPRIGAMTRVAGGGRGDVITGFPLGGHIVVATGAGAKHFQVIHPQHRGPQIGAVAGLALV